MSWFECISTSCWMALTWMQQNACDKKSNFKQADHWTVPCPVNKIPNVLILAMRAWRANEQDVPHLEANTLPKNLTSGESAQWLLSSGVRKIPGALIMPMDMPIMPIWANDQDVAHLQAKTVPMNLIWSESAQWLLSCHVHKVWAGRTDGRRAFHSPPLFPLERAGDKKKSKEVNISSDCLAAPSHYPSQFWRRTLLSYCITTPNEFKDDDFDKFLEWRQMNQSSRISLGGGHTDILSVGIATITDCINDYLTAGNLVHGYKSVDYLT